MCHQHQALLKLAHPAKGWYRSHPASEEALTPPAPVFPGALLSVEVSSGGGGTMVRSPVLTTDGATAGKCGDVTGCAVG
jgi:hypothetical protein